MKDFITLAETRYSVRKFKDTPVEKEKIQTILKAAKLAPTACNYQPQKVYVVTSESARAALKTVSPCTFDAPVIFVVGYDPERSSKGRRKEGDNFGETDAAIITSHLMFAAEDLGLGSCWVGYFNSEEVKQALGITDNVVICDLLPVGYKAEESVPSPMHSSFREDDDMVKWL